MTPLGPGEMRARRRPWVVLSVATVRLVCGFVLALPLASVIGESGVGQLPQGDRALFEDGSYLLLEVLRLKGADLFAIARGLMPLFALGLLLTAACNAALLVALNLRGRLAVMPWLASAASRVPALLVLGFGVGLAQGLLLVVAVGTGEALPAPLNAPVTFTLVELGLGLFVLLLAGAIGGFSDVVKASLVRYESTLLPAVKHALRCARQRPLMACWGWLPFAAILLLGMVLASSLTEALDVSQPGAWRVAAVLALHQLVIVGAVWCRAAWFARALRLAASDVAA